MVEARTEVENAVNLSITREQVERLGEFLGDLNLYRGFQKLLANHKSTTPFSRWVSSQFDECQDSRLRIVYYHLLRGRNVEIRPNNKPIKTGDYEVLLLKTQPTTGSSDSFGIEQETLELLIDVLYPQVRFGEFEENDRPSKKQIKEQGVVLSRV